jgi:hypothetical protein
MSAINPPIRGQYMAAKPYPPQPYAWSAICSFAVGKAQATWSRRSWRKTKRIWLGGRSPSGWAGRNVAQGPASETAHRWFWRK